MQSAASFTVGQKLIRLLALFWHPKLRKAFTLLHPKPFASLIIRQKGRVELLNQFSFFTVQGNLSVFYI